MNSVTDLLDARILRDTTLTREVFAQMLAAQRRLGLLHGERPTCPFLRPHILSRRHYDEIAHASEVLATAFERAVDVALEDEALLAEFGLTVAEERMARVDPGYRSLCVNSRLDAFVTDTGFQFFEYNAESPAGVGDQMQLEKVLFELPHNRELLDQMPHWRPEPHRRLLEGLLTAYAEWGGEQSRPQIAIVDWEGVSTASEFRVLQEYFAGEGYPTVIADPRSLSYHAERLWAGEFRIDIFYKRVIIHEFLEQFDEQHPLARAYIARRVCMANSFRSKIAHKKSSLAVLSDPRFENLFTQPQRDMIQRHIPWTRFVRRGPTTFEGRERDLSEIMLRERERLVLKPNDDYGGHGVIFGWETDEAAWTEAVARAHDQPYVVQERVPVRKITIPMFTDVVEVVEMFVDFDPFLFHNQVEGGLVRLSAAALTNVTSGGGETALLVIEDTDASAATGITEPRA
jgi:glutathionylspermidine synthase